MKTLIFIGIFCLSPFAQAARLTVDLEIYTQPDPLRQSRYEVEAVGNNSGLCRRWTGNGFQTAFCTTTDDTSLTYVITQLSNSGAEIDSWQFFFPLNGGQDTSYQRRHDIQDPITRYTLTLARTPSGISNIIRLNQPGPYQAGFPVTLTAEPIDGWQFSGWSGVVTGTQNPIIFAMPAANSSVLATFTPIGQNDDLNLSPDTRSIAATGGNGTFTVSSDTSWNWSSNAAWLTSNESTTQDGNQTFSYSVSPNTSSEARTATITIAAGNLTRTHTVTQAGTPQAETTIETTLETFIVRPGQLYALSLGFTAESGKSYRIESSSNLRDWSVRETGITGNGDIIQRSYSFNPSARLRWFLRIREE